MWQIGLKLQGHTRNVHGIASKANQGWQQPWKPTLRIDKDAQYATLILIPNQSIIKKALGN